jgi:O-antigen/teichoic acid export membrane protein
MKPAPLVIIAVLGQTIAWIVSAIVARTLGVEAFEAYVVASAIFILIASLAPLGSEKLALRRLPAMLARGDLAQARAFLRFGLWRTAPVAAFAAATVALWALATLPPSDMRLAIWMTCLSLPAGALAHYGVEVLTAAGEPRRALLLFRLLVPLVALLTLLLAVAGPWVKVVSGAWAVAGWGLGWLIAFTAMVMSARRRLPPALLATPPAQVSPGWQREAMPFLIHRLSMSLLAQAPILALERLGAPPGEVGAYAAAATTAGLLAVIATSTNRAYGRQLGLLIEARDRTGLLAARRARRRWVLPAVGIPLVAGLAVPGPILALFRPEFVEVGTAPLRLLGVATAFTVLFALAPTCLKFSGRNDILYRSVASAAAVQLVLLGLLVPPLGATGAALAYLLSLGGLYTAFALLAQRAVARIC